MTLKIFAVFSVSSSVLLKKSIVCKTLIYLILFPEEEQISLASLLTRKDKEHQDVILALKQKYEQAMKKVRHRNEDELARLQGIHEEVLRHERNAHDKLVEGLREELQRSNEMIYALRKEIGAKVVRTDSAATKDVSK